VAPLKKSGFLLTSVFSLSGSDIITIKSSPWCIYSSKDVMTVDNEKRRLC